MIKESDVTIIIPHLGGTKESEYSLDQCLLSLRETVPNMDMVVVSNGLKCEKEDHHILSSVKISYQGQCKAVNAAVSTTNTPWVMVTNDDMIYPEGWFEKLMNGFTGNPCISPKLIEPKSGAPTFETWFCGGAGGDFDKDKFLEFSKDYGKLESWRTGFNLPFVIRRDLWDMIGGYDINYDPWGSNSDSDLEYKIKLSGIQPYQNPKCPVYHFSQTSGTFEPRNQSYWQKNWDYFIQKWGFPRTDDGIWQASFDIPNEGRIFRPDWENKYGIKS